MSLVWFFRLYVDGVKVIFKSVLCVCWVFFMVVFMILLLMMLVFVIFFIFCIVIVFEGSVCWVFMCLFLWTMIDLSFVWSMLERRIINFLFLMLFKLYGFSLSWFVVWSVFNVFMCIIELFIKVELCVVLLLFFLSLLLSIEFEESEFNVVSNWIKCIWKLWLFMFVFWLIILCWFILMFFDGLRFFMNLNDDISFIGCSLSFFMTRNIEMIFGVCVGV